ncbi:sodium:phosphate symporter [Devosia limi DSM 17137]|uniref:Phosphate:Na+ symporter n=1 Tax=Devosia limi DSM 17137 TaxID=1121477 RepID=A0A0F5LUH1_9HYPH|nr:Na/Pi cotransporter family protein [Devosia limi]KKB85936.1 sodium:phosphate symporter [Devosia limi DSM 17137]SHF01391.1 phosphate:Na+ symporter [Devosia limi DSM 17137]
MNSTIQLINLLGAGALLLWGLRLIKSGVMRAFGASLRQWIAKGTGNRFMAALSGFFATLALQSSTATAVITASFAGRGVVDPKMGQAVMLGANVGTSIAAVILSMDVHWFASAFMLIGVATFQMSKYARGKGIGRAILGLGLMLLALQLVGTVTGPLRESSVVIAILKGLGDAPVFALMFSAGLAFVASSSLAVVLFVALLAQAGIVAPSLAIILVAGANLGGAIPPLVAVSSEGVEARRLTLANLIVRALGALALMIFAMPAANLLLAILPNANSLTIAAHIAFNLALLIVFLPLLGPIAKIARIILPPPPQAEAAASYLDESALDTPVVALAGAARETLRVGDLVLKMLQSSLDALRQPTVSSKGLVSQLDDDVDTIQRSIKFYLSRLDCTDLDADDAGRSAEIMGYAINLEHVGDIIDGGLSECASKQAKRQVKFSPEGLAEITKLYETTIANMQLAQSVFLTRDPSLARQLVAAKATVRRLEAGSTATHLARVRQRNVEAVETSSLHLDILADLKRINGHLASVAYAVLETSGELSESRLLSAPEATASVIPT